MKILFVMEYFTPHIGGAEVLFDNLCKGLAAGGNEVTIITSKLNGTKEFEISEGVKIHRVKVPLKGARYWFTFLSIPKILKNAKYCDLINTTTYNGAFPAWIVARLRKKPCIITVLESNPAMWKESGFQGIVMWMHKLYENFLFRLPFTRYVAISEYTRECLVKYFGVSKSKIDIIYCGVDYELFNPVKANGTRVRKNLQLNGEFTYIYYGRPGFTKGVEYLINAVPMISKNINNSKLILILAKDPKSRYEDIIRRIEILKIADKVILLEPVSREELPDYISAADCVVIPSLTEGFGLSAAEACAMKKPLVTTNICSLPEVVSGKCVLVEPRNAKAISEGVIKVFKDDTDIRALKLFTWNECINRYFHVYTEIMSEEDFRK